MWFLGRNESGFGDRHANGKKWEEYEANKTPESGIEKGMI
jgi:hypothetical protein